MAQLKNVGDSRPVSPVLSTNSPNFVSLFSHRPITNGGSDHKDDRNTLANVDTNTTLDGVHFSINYNDIIVGQLQTAPIDNSTFRNYSTKFEFQSRIVSPSFNHSDVSAVPIRRLSNPHYFPDVTFASDVKLTSVETIFNSFSNLTYTFPSIGESLETTHYRTLEKLTATVPTSVIQLCSAAYQPKFQQLTNFCTLKTAKSTNSSPRTEKDVFLNFRGTSSSSIVASQSPTNSKAVVNLVEKRNARERTRVHTVNQAFSLLKNRLPSIRANTKRVSKLKILKAAVNYIHSLNTLLNVPSMKDALCEENLTINDINDKNKPVLPVHVKCGKTSMRPESSEYSTTTAASKFSMSITNAEAAILHHFSTSGLLIAPTTTSFTLPSTSTGDAQTLSHSFISPTELLTFSECASSLFVGVNGGECASQDTIMPSQFPIAHELLSANASVPSVISFPSIAGIPYAIRSAYY